MKALTKKGFTLVELIAVTAIIAFLAYASVPFGESIYQNARTEQVETSLDMVRNALDKYYQDHGHYPIIPTFTQTDIEGERFNAFQVLERELTGKEVDGFPDIYERKTQRIYLTELPVNPYTGRKDDWEIRDTYLPAWHPVNEAMNPVPAPGTSFTFGASGGTGATGTYTGGVGQATGTFYNADNLQKTRDIFDIRFPSYLHKTVVKGGHERNLSEF